MKLTFWHIKGALLNALWVCFNDKENKAHNTAFWSSGLLGYPGKGQKFQISVKLCVY